MSEMIIDLETAIRLACEDLAKEDADRFDSLDVSDVTVSEKITRIFKRKLRSAIFKASTGYKIFQKTAIACVVAFAVLFGVVATVEPVRAYFWKIFIKQYDEYFEVEMVPDDKIEYPTYFKEYRKPVLPEGWTIKSSHPDNIETGGYIITTADGREIAYFQMVANYSSWMDNSPHVIKEITLKNGAKAYLFEYEDGCVILQWQTDYKFSLGSFQVGSDELIKLANTIE